MKKNVTRIICLILVLLLVLSAIPALAVSAAAADANEPADIVLVLDCSGSLFDNDPDELCIEACKAFVDTLPASKEVRVSLLTIGYKSKDVYDPKNELFEDWFIPTGSEFEFTHLNVPLGELNSTEDRDNFKNAVLAAVDKAKHTSASNTSIGASLAAAVDILESNGTSSDNGCIIFVSDGIDAPCHSFYKTEMPKMIEYAKEKAYSTYCVQLAYGNSGTAEERKKAPVLLDQICNPSGNQEVGRINCEKLIDVHVALQRIFCDFFELPYEEPAVVSELPAEYSFTIPELTSEATVNIFGSGLEYVELINVADNTVQKINKDIESERLMAVVEPGSYYSLKMIVPAAGEWKVKMYGTEGGTAQVSLLVSNTAMQEMELDMKASAVDGKEMTGLTKNDAIQVNACFEYHGIEVTNSQFYVNNQASLLVHTKNGNTLEFPMEADTSGYKLKLDLSKVPSGESKLQVKLDHTMFRGGVKLSNQIPFSMKNLDLETLGAEGQTYKGYVNNPLERIDMTAYFNNPDNDPITYTVECVSDRSVTFEFTADSDYLEIQGGMVPGTFQVKITYADPDMTTPGEQMVTLVVEDRAPTAKRIPKQKIWIDSYSFQSTEQTSATLNLDEYFNDPDGVQMTYTITAENDNAKLTQDGSLLLLEPAAKGDCTLTVVGNDGVSDITAEIKVDVVSGKAVFWQQNWIWFALALAVLVIIIIVIIVIAKNKLVKGVWNIEVTDGMNRSAVDGMNIAAYTMAGKKSKFTLSELMQELMNQGIMTNTDSVSTRLFNALQSTGAGNIKLIGVTRKTGCDIANVPATTDVQVSNNGTMVTGKASVTGGCLSIVINDMATNSTITVNMTLSNW